MNAIKTTNRIDLYMDIPRSARIYRLDYDNAVNDAIEVFIEREILSGVQNDQVVSDNLYTLLKTQTAAPTATIALYPADYRFLVSVNATIAAVAYYARPTTQAKLGPQEADTFKRSSATKPYYIQQLTGFKIYSGGATVTSVDLNYLKVPSTFNCGKEALLINAAPAVLTNALVYIFTEPGVFNGTAYNIGDEFTCATTTTLATGQVILKANTTAIELPDKTHDQIAKIAADLLLKAIGRLQQAQAIESEAVKP